MHEAEKGENNQRENTVGLLTFKKKTNVHRLQVFTSGTSICLDRLYNVLTASTCGRLDGLGIFFSFFFKDICLLNISQLTIHVSVKSVPLRQSKRSRLVIQDNI